jgi:hypothetical protein
LKLRENLVLADREMEDLAARADRTFAAPSREEAAS